MNVGIDIIDVRRFNKQIKKESFLEKNFTLNEINYINNASKNTLTIAGIFAAKEALLKSLKQGINNYPVKDIEIIHDENNAPYINLHNSIKEKYASKNFDVSISHESSIAIAIVICY